MFVLRPKWRWALITSLAVPVAGMAAASALEWSRGGLRVSVPALPLAGVGFASACAAVVSSTRSLWRDLETLDDARYHHKQA